MKNLIYYNKDKFDIYFKKITNKYEKSNISDVYIKDINKFNIKNSIIIFEVRDFLIKSLFMPLDNYIGDRILNSLKFYFNSFNDDILYDYFLLDSDINNGQVRILLYAMKIKKDVQEILKYIDKSYLVVRPLQFIIVEYISNKFNTKNGILINKIDSSNYNIIMFRNSLILLNDYINADTFNNLDIYIIDSMQYVKKEFNVSINNDIYFLNCDQENISCNYKFKCIFSNHTVEEILREHDYIRSKFFKFWKKRENFKMNA